MNRNLFAIPFLLSMTALAGCSSSADVTSAEVTDFSSEVQKQVPSMQQYKDAGDLKKLVESVCESFSGGQSYGNVSETVGAYIDKPASSAEVDGVIAVALETACPELKDKATG